MIAERPSVCPLGCPDTCSLTVTVEGDRVVKVRGSRANPLTVGGALHQGPDAVSGLRARAGSADHSAPPRAGLTREDAAFMVLNVDRYPQPAGEPPPLKALSRPGPTPRRRP